MNAAKRLRKLSYATLISSISLCSINAHADTFLGIYADANYWNYQGDVNFNQTNSTDTGFNFDKNSSAMLSLAFEHGVPLLPNIKVKHVSMDSSRTQNTNLSLQGVNFSTDTTATVDLTLTDVIAYYELLDNIVSVDVGLAAKIIDGNVAVKNTTSTLDEKLSETIPAVYASAGGNLPFTGLSAKAEVSGMSYDNNSLIDAQAEIKYDVIDNIALDVGVKAGYRMIEVEVDKVLDTNATSSFKGPFLGIEAHF